AYLGHRGTSMWQSLARANVVLPIWAWQQPGASYGHSATFAPILALHEVLQPTILFRAGLWLVLAFAVAAFAWRTRATPEGNFAVAVAMAAIASLLSSFPF